ncbi:hypothetical protein KUTeg_014174, partial [Tegillarca granosa]
MNFNIKTGNFSLTSTSKANSLSNIQFRPTWSRYLCILSSSELAGVKRQEEKEIVSVPIEVPCKSCPHLEQCVPVILNVADTRKNTRTPTGPKYPVLKINKVSMNEMVETCLFITNFVCCISTDGGNLWWKPACLSLTLFCCIFTDGGNLPVYHKLCSVGYLQLVETCLWWKPACLSLICAVLLTPIIIMLLPAPIEPIAYRYRMVLCLPFVFIATVGRFAKSNLLSLLLPEPPLFEGALQPNNYLQQAERIYENQVLGPESMVADGDHLYAGTADGKVIDIWKGEIRVLAKFGVDPCGSFEDEPTCGRPLGMRLDKDGYLIVADGYLGLFKVNVATGDVLTLWPSSAPVNGKKMKLVNDLAIARDGMIYFTDSSTKWDRRHNRYCILEAESSGRLIEYNPVTNTTKELVSDNIRPSSSGGYWVGMATARRGGKFSLLDFAASRPWLRKLITKMIPKYGLAIEINEDGKIIRSLHDPTGQVVPAVSEIEDKDGVLYLGSYNLPFLSRLYLRNSTCQRE